MLLALPAAAQTGPVGSPTCADANLTLAPGETPWNCYEFYDLSTLPADNTTNPVTPEERRIHRVTIYDMEAVTLDASGGIEENWLQRVERSGPDNAKSLKCVVNEDQNPWVGCDEDASNALVRDWYWFDYGAPAIYNHMPALAFFDGAWWAIWSSNDKKTPSANETNDAQDGLVSQGKIPSNHNMFPDYANIEGVTGQRILLSKSVAAADTPAGRRAAFLSGWSTPTPEGVFRDQLSVDPLSPYDPTTNPENPDNRQWAPDLLVVDVEQPVGGTTQELWAFFTQNLGDRGRGSYFGRLKRAADDPNPVPEWDVTRIDFTGLTIDPADGFAFLSANSLQLKHQPDPLDNGRVLIPIMPVNETAGNGIPHDGGVLYTDDGGLTWNTSARIIPPPAFNIWEPIFAEHPDTGHLFLYFKNREASGLPSSQMLLYSTSTDRGETWSAVEAMPLEVPGIGGHAFSFGNRIALIHHDFENGKSGVAGARQDDRTGRVTDSGPTGGYQDNDKINMALFFSRTGEIGTFLPGPTLTTNQLDIVTDDDGDPLTNPLPAVTPANVFSLLNQRGADLAHMTYMDDTLYMIHRSSRSIRGAVIDYLPDPNSFYLYPRTAVEIVRDDGDDKNNWANCPGEPDGYLKNWRALFFDSSYCAYRVTFLEEGRTRLLPRLDRQASVSIETEQADFDAAEVLQLQFDFTSRLKSTFMGSKRRIALLTIGGPDDYGYIEVGNKAFPLDVVYVQGGSTTVLGSYDFERDNWGKVDVWVHNRGISIALEGSTRKDICIEGGISWQKLFFGYGYTQGKSYLEQAYNPLGWFRFRTDHVKTRIINTNPADTCPF